MTRSRSCVDCWRSDVDVDRSAKIYVAGHTGLVGSALVRRLRADGFTNLLLRTRAQVDLRDQHAVRALVSNERPEFVVDCAARVGGIQANLSHPAKFLYDNLQIQNNLIWAAKDAGVATFLFLGSSCMYPLDSPQPIAEERLMTGRLEPTNEAYALAKIAGMKLCEYIHAEADRRRFISCVPTNVYGPHDTFDPQTSHVIPSLIRRMHEAKIAGAPDVVVWGTGASRREFLYVDDLADAILWVLRHWDDTQFLNIGTGQDLSIRELAESVRTIVGYGGNLVFDATRPDGMPRKVLDVSRLHATGWRHRVDLRDGLVRTYRWYLANVCSER
jgi:GDP-L-fucose synthase